MVTLYCSGFQHTVTTVATVRSPLIPEVVTGVLALDMTAKSKLGKQTRLGKARKIANLCGIFPLGETVAVMTIVPVSESRAVMTIWRPIFALWPAYKPRNCYNRNHARVRRSPPFARTIYPK